ncbi:hypothetical protein DCS_00297 [Drechmeria coniospora]|uniref:Zn(2)-C6 fungal-type domain-containing protein n=1 Tax=Drechmeria coniospora TaxID=98403 RepID=A0A151GPX9_DRECN|nr:hypothetical protein DCS_00297 [Drechmeria coniospora]KYK59167.1 hypothetical protein DCS_00297 [Drechmeria coniospora]
MTSSRLFPPTTGGLTKHDTDGPFMSRPQPGEHMMTTFAVTKQKRATRAKFAKVRTGCITCKRRHVKCDEAKPCCKNCLKWAGFCSGYESAESLQSRSPKVAKNKRAEPAAQACCGDSSSTADDASSVASTMSLSPPSHADEPVSASVSAAGFDDVFWKQTLPRLVRDSAAVRCANMAVHALLFAKDPAPAAGCASDWSDRYERALACYGRALRIARQQASVKPTDVREAVLCSMFFVIFETINEDEAAAEAHLQSGQRVLDELGPRHVTGETPRLRTMLRRVLQCVANQARQLDYADHLWFGIPLDEFLDE